MFFIIKNTILKKTFFPTLGGGYDKLITAIERIIHLHNIYLLLSTMVKLATIK